MRGIFRQDRALPQGFSETFKKRFWSKVIKTDNCWLWDGADNGRSGYGAINKGARGAGNVGAHVASWILHNGPIPSGLNVCHSCDNRICVNPDHLWIGTTKQNAHDMSIKGRSTAGDRSASCKLSWEQVNEIRSNPNNLTQDRLAEVYHVSQATIWRIIRSIGWRP